MNGTAVLHSIVDGVLTGSVYALMATGLTLIFGVMNIINVALCWIFIFGHLGAPRMGVTGAGMSAFVATWIGLLIMLIYAWLLRADFVLRSMQR